MISYPDRITYPEWRDALIRTLREWHDLSEDETIVFAALFAAAENDEVCPTGEDLNELTGCTSDSASRYQVERLERKGLLRVERGMRFRRVQIMATGKWTARHPNDKSSAPHVPRGTHDPAPLHKAIKALKNVEPSDVTQNLASLSRFEKMLESVMAFTARHKIGMLSGNAKCRT